MGKCILLGNGINLHLGIKELESDKIKDRFLNLLRLEKGVFLSVFPHQWDFDTCYRSIKESNVYGIEVLSRYLYSSIKNANISEWSENDEDRLQDLVSCIALNAIFFNDSTMHKIYEDEGSYDFIYQIPIIISTQLFVKMVIFIIIILVLGEEEMENSLHLTISLLSQKK